MLLKIVIHNGGGLTEKACIGHKGTNCVFVPSLSRLHDGTATHHLLIHSFLLKQSRGRLTVGGEKRLAGWRDWNKQWFLTRTPFQKTHFISLSLCLILNLYSDWNAHFLIHNCWHNMTCEYSHISRTDHIFFNSQALCFDFSTHKWRSQDCKSTSSAAFRMASQLPNNNIINK